MTTENKNAYELALVAGDLSKLNPNERISYYNAVCESLGLNYLTKPFEYITLNGKLQLYATRACTEQLRATKKVSLEIEKNETKNDVYVVTARATILDEKGFQRCDTSTGAVSLQGLKGNDLANAIMKAETKAKRRVTLSICGLGWLDESEIETIPAKAFGSPKHNLNEKPINRALPAGTQYEPIPADKLEWPYNHKIQTKSTYQGHTVESIGKEGAIKVLTKFDKGTHATDCDACHAYLLKEHKTTVDVYEDFLEKKAKLGLAPPLTNISLEEDTIGETN